MKVKVLTVIAVAWWKLCMCSWNTTRTSSGQIGPSTESHAASSCMDRS